MAFWYRAKDGKVRIYIYSLGVQKALPRAESKHLDGCGDREINIYVDSIFKKTHKVSLADDALDRLLDQFAEYELSRGLDIATRKARQTFLRSNAIPFFLEHRLKDPSTWHQKSPQLLAHLQSRSISHANIVRTNVAINKFWGWLQDEQLVLSGVNLRLRKPVSKAKPTVLQYALTPEQTLTYARSASPLLAFIALTGYFCSLRTQETLALVKGDFRGGSATKDLECSKVMRNAGLYDKLVVNISRQFCRTDKTISKAPKAGSAGLVCCFDEEAARLIVECIRTLSVDGVIFKFGLEYYTKLWRKEGIAGITLKDLRRASIYWLGHYSKLGIVELKSHSRHNKTDTTTLYLRRPEQVVASGELDLDA